jgi:hypothetical protein
MARQAHDHAHDGNGVHAEALEQRVCRLEDAVAAMQDTHLMEDRLVERVVQRVEHMPLPPASESTGLIVSAARMLLPKTVDSLPENGSPPPSADTVRSAWLIVTVLDELRWMVRMLTDYRYRMTWTGRAVLVTAVIIGVLSWFMVSGLPLVGGVLDRLVLVLTAVVTYRAMCRELERYRDLMSRLWRYR